MKKDKDFFKSALEINFMNEQDEEKNWLRTQCCVQSGRIFTEKIIIINSDSTDNFKNVNILHSCDPFLSCLVFVEKKMFLCMNDLGGENCSEQHFM
jgi:hypothetical protein